MITVVRSPFSRQKDLVVPSGRIDRRPPKIIVGVSLTLGGESPSFPRGVITLPAILDTGFNRALEIDEWQLVHWAGIRKEHLAAVSNSQVSRTVLVGMVSRAFQLASLQSIANTNRHQTEVELFLAPAHNPPQHDSSKRRLR